MGKRVTFNDAVEVRNLSVNSQEHIQEIKNPQNLIRVTSDPPGPTIPEAAVAPPEDSRVVWWWWVIGVVLVCIAAYVFRVYFSSHGWSAKNAKKNLGK